jgi:hypothetical protein
MSTRSGGKDDAIRSALIAIFDFGGDPHAGIIVP